MRGGQTFAAMMGGVASAVLLGGALAVTSAALDVAPAEAQAPDREFTIAVGETLTFNARGIQRVTVGLPTVANVKTTSDGGQLLVTGASTGVTTLNIFSGDGQKTLLVRVVGVNPVALSEEVREVLGERSGVDVRVVKGRVLLEGEVSSQVFKDKIDKLVALYPNQVLNFTTYREAFVEGAKMVALDMYFVQVATTNRDNLGMNWGQFFGANLTFGSGQVPLYYGEDAAGQAQQAFGAGILPGENNPLRLPSAVALTGGQGLTGYWSLVGNLNLALDLLTEHGLIKTVQHGVMITEAGTEAEYHSGGTILLEVSGLGATQLVEKEFGLIVKIRPVVDVDNRIKLEIGAEYSELDFATGVGDLPALRNTTFKGIVNLKEGQSVLVGGFDGDRVTSNESGWWLLSRIPIVGWLFKSRSYFSETNNNAFFVTPKLYEPGGRLHKELIEGIFDDLLKAGAEPDDLPELQNATAPARRTTTAPAAGGGAGQEGE